MQDYEKEYNTFWKSIVEKDGKLDKEQIMKELYDYSIVMNNCQRIYWLVSNGKCSTPTIEVKHLESELNENYYEMEALRDDLKWLLDSNKDLNSLKSEIKEFFRIEEK